MHLNVLVATNESLVVVPSLERTSLLVSAPGRELLVQQHWPGDQGVSSVPTTPRAPGRIRVRKQPTRGRLLRMLGKGRTCQKLRRKEMSLEGRE